MQARRHLSCASSGHSLAYDESPDGCTDPRCALRTVPPSPCRRRPIGARNTEPFPVAGNRLLRWDTPTEAR